VTRSRSSTGGGQIENFAMKQNSPLISFVKRVDIHAVEKIDNPTGRAA
jgi:hypothetical protein